MIAWWARIGPITRAGRGGPRLGAHQRCDRWRSGPPSTQARSGRAWTGRTTAPTTPRRGAARRPRRPPWECVITVAVERRTTAPADRSSCPAVRLSHRRVWKLTSPSRSETLCWTGILPLAPHPCRVVNCTESSFTSSLAATSAEGTSLRMTSSIGSPLRSDRPKGGGPGQGGRLQIGKETPEVSEPYGLRQRAGLENRRDSLEGARPPPTSLVPHGYIGQLHERVCALPQPRTGDAVSHQLEPVVRERMSRAGHCAPCLR